MMRLEITHKAAGLPQGMAGALRELANAALAAEGLSGRYQADVMIVDDAQMLAINEMQRGVASATDVLSFPMVAYAQGRTARDSRPRLRRAVDPETGCIHLGDIVISLPRAAAQAGEYGHSLAREVGFLLVHGLLHLMGYDHETDAQRGAMRAMEESIMADVGLNRELTDADWALIEGARKAMERAYVPYSHYPVGACLRTTDGQLFAGCNVENASFGLTLCAERNAMTTAVTQGMRSVEAIAITGVGAMPYPCGACRQFLREFGRDTRVIIASDTRIEVSTLEELLPLSFGPESLKEAKG